MIIYDFEKKGKTPIYEYLCECIRKDIRSGKLKPGEKLPSRRRMASDNGIAEITVANAYAQLITEGYVESREKSGYYVSPDLDENLMGYADVTQEKNDEKPGKTCLSKTCLQADAPRLIDLTNPALPEETFPFDTWSKLTRRILSSGRSECIKAPSPTGVYALREAISGYLGRARGFSPDPDNIVIGPGSEYINSLLLMLMGRSAMVGVEDPGYRAIGKLYENSGHKCLHIPVDENGLKTDRLKGSNIRMVHVSPSHHFPLGVVMSAARRSALVSWAKESDAWIVEDDYDSEFRFEGRPVPPLVLSDPSRVIYVNTFTRTLSPSVRIAYMVLPESLMQLYKKRVPFMSGSVSTLDQLTLASFISEGFYERHLNRVRNFYRKRRNAIFEIINGEASEYFFVNGDGSGMTFLLKNKQIKETESVDEDFLKSAKRYGTILNSVKKYVYNTSNFHENGYVVNFGSVTEEEFSEATHIMCKAMREILCQNSV